jgi:hypothetical protein
MDIPAVFTSMAEGAITLAGFASVFRAFHGAEDPDGYSRLRLTIVIEGGLMVAFLCYLPSWLASLDLSSDAVWKLSSAIGAIWPLFRFILVASGIVRRGRPFPVLYLFAAPVGLISFLVFAATAVGFIPVSAYSGFLLGTGSLLATVGIVFVAQFRAERG